MRPTSTMRNCGGRPGAQRRRCTASSFFTTRSSPSSAPLAPSIAPPSPLPLPSFLTTNASASSRLMLGKSISASLFLGVQQIPYRPRIAGPITTHTFSQSRWPLPRCGRLVSDGYGLHGLHIHFPLRPARCLGDIGRGVQFRGLYRCQTARHTATLTYKGKPTST